MARDKTIITVISKISERAQSRNAAVVVIYGLDMGRKYDLMRATTTFGRAPKADVLVDQESVSRNHAKIHIEKNQVTIKDLGSTNGTYVNDDQIKGDYTLRNGDLIKIGRTIFKFLAGGNIEAAYHEEIYRLTTVDGLTQIYNRRYFEDAIEREVSRANRYKRELSLVMIDIDKFKNVNDMFGHLAGDHVLKQIALALKGKIRREDTFARFGGEEFALLLPEVGIQGAKSMAEKARKLVEKKKFSFDGQDIPVTISVGVGRLEVGKSESAALLREADAKLYEAKSSGRNCVRA